MILSRGTVEDLRRLAEVWPEETVLIGASALVFSHGMSWRATSDLDLVLAVEVDDLRRALPPGWRRGKLPHRVIGGHGTRFDLVPASAPLRAAGQVTWEDGVIMSLAGIELAFRHATERELDGHRLRVAPTAVIAALKMVSYLDRPAERSRDLRDLAHLLSEYVGDDDERRFEEGRGLDLDFDLVAAFLLGKDVGALVARDPDVVGAVGRFLVVADEIAESEWRRIGPPSWSRADLEPRDYFAAFSRGVDEGGGRAP